MTEQEKKDLQLMWEAKDKIRIDCVDLQMFMLEQKDFSLYGYRDLNHALESILKDAVKKMRKLQDAHVKKYPD